MIPAFNQTIYRWSSSCLIVGTILLTMGYWLRPYIEKDFVHEFASDSALASSLLVGSGTLLLLVGLPALLAKQIVNSGKGSLFSAGLTFIGLAAFHLGTLSLYFVLPVLVTHSPATKALVYSDVPPFPRFALFWAVSLLIQVIGLVWLGLKTWQTALYPRAAAFCLILGGLLLLVSPPLNFRLLQPATTVVMAGILWCGVSLFRQSGTARAMPSDAVPSKLEKA